MCRIFFIFVLIVTLAVIFLDLYLDNKLNFGPIENFNQYYQTYQSYMPINTYKYPLPIQNYYTIPYLNGWTNLPWSNTQLGNTTNMSYDLRGDPLIIPKNNFVWLNSSIFPIYNKSI